MPEFKLREDSPITLVEMRPRSFGRLDGSEPPDVAEIARWDPRALPIIHAVTKKAGFTNVKSIAPAFNPGGKITKDDWQRSFQSKVVGASAISRTVDVSLEYLSRCKKENPCVLTVIGGHHATFDPEYCLNRGADIAVIGEGEETWPEVLTQLTTKGTYEGVRGIAYKRGDKIVFEGHRPLLTKEKMSELPLPVYDERVLKGRNRVVIESGRGCPYDCTFCGVNEFYEGKYRKRPIEVTLEEWRILPRNIRIFWRDDNFAADVRGTKELLEAGIREKLPPLGTVQVSIHAAKDRELVRLFKKAGVSAFCIGFESANEDSLQQVDKHASVEENEEAAVVCIEEGVPTFGMFILGMDTDTPESIKKTVDFAIKYTSTAQFFALGPLVGTKHTAKLRNEGRILSEKYHTSPKHYLADGFHVLFEPAHFTPLGLQKAVPNAFGRYYDLRKTHWGDIEDIKHRIYAAYATHRVLRDPQTKEHLNFLESIEPPRVFPGIKGLVRSWFS